MVDAEFIQWFRNHFHQQWVGQMKRDARFVDDVRWR
tara:strand:+ start:163 stop:270 length:108 start_codon:yes stop_codon:yes gene_type:complete